jgi:TIR domain
LRIFLSFASKDRTIAERIQLALLGAGHDVFFDESSLPPGGDYHSRIRRAIEDSQFFVSLISPNSVGAGRYARSELKFAKAQWPKPWGYVLPVMISPTEYELIDPYLASVTVLEPKGDFAAEVAAAVALTESAKKRKWFGTIASLVSRWTRRPDGDSPKIPSKYTGWLTRRRLLTATGATGAAVALGAIAYKARPTFKNLFSNEPSIADIAAKQGPIDAITTIATRSDIAQYVWKDRGKAPRGYIMGMALVYARVYLKLGAKNAAAIEMAKANTGDWDNDVLAFYRDTFGTAGMRNAASGASTLRHLFVLLIGLGMRESSGRYCEGRDRSVSNVSGESAETGLFQSSFQIMSASPLLPELFNYYLAHPSGFADVFDEGVGCRTEDRINVGDGDGRKFQKLSKQCPAFAAEFAAVGLRNARREWGPINRRDVEIRPERDVMLRQVQDFVDQRPDISAALE